jgi:hypothetical protein
MVRRTERAMNEDIRQAYEERVRTFSAKVETFASSLDEAEQLWLAALFAAAAGNSEAIQVNKDSSPASGRTVGAALVEFLASPKAQGLIGVAQQP